MAEDKQELLQHFDGLRRELLAAIEGLTDEQLCETTIDGWSVKDHLLHLALWDDVRAAEVERISAGQASAWPMDGPQDDLYNDLGYKLRAGLSLAQARWEFDNSRRKLIAALEASTERGRDAGLYGAAGLKTDHESEHAGWIRRWRGERGY